MQIFMPKIKHKLDKQVQLNILILLTERPQQLSQHSLPL